jgi:lipid-binding SYLF domain-containing protein
MALLLALILGSSSCHTTQPPPKQKAFATPAPQDTSLRAADREPAKRLGEAASVFSEIMAAPDRGIPQDLLEKAHCIIIVPGLTTEAFIVGGKYGKGYLSCRNKSGSGWSAPATVRIEGGSVGFQIGGSSTDLIMLVMSERGADRLLGNRVTLGDEATAAAGPVGRTATAQTDARMDAEVLSWARSKGLFAGIALHGATLREDLDDNAALYGQKLKYRDIVTNGRRAPKSAAPLMALLNKYGPPASAVAPDLGRPLTWNAWIEDDAPQLSFRPLQNLRPSQDYIVGVDLAAFAYRASAGALGSRPVSSSLRRWLDLPENKNKDVVWLKALVVPDPSFFTTSDQSFVDLRIERGLIDRYDAQSATPPEPTDSMADLRENSHPSYRFGYLTPTTPLKVHTGARNGRTYLAVSFWRGIEPLDSIVVPVCVSKSDAADVCGPFSDPVFSTSNIERLNVGAPDPSTETPCASLHFIEAGNATMAVLLTADPASHPVFWQLDRLPTITQKISTYLRNFASASTDESRLGVGADIFDALLPPESAAAARDVFGKLLADRKKNLSDVPPLVWVRVDPRDPAQIFSIPLALAAVDREMLGDWFRVQSTLRRQDYQTLGACISNWVKLLPPPTATDFETAKPFMADRIPGGFTDTFHNNIQDFRSWIRDRSHSEDRPTVLLTLSHYFTGGIGFNQADWVGPDAIHRPFTQPSVALIEGCDGAEPNADGFLQGLNMVGFQAIITTTGPVKPYMAGQYFKLLNEMLDRNPNYTLSRAHFEAVKALEQEKGEKALATDPSYGLKALIFSLLGDGSLKVCSLHL